MARATYQFNLERALNGGELARLAMVVLDIDVKGKEIIMAFHKEYLEIKNCRECNIILRKSDRSWCNFFNVHFSEDGVKTTSLIIISLEGDCVLTCKRITKK